MRWTVLLYGMVMGVCAVLAGLHVLLWLRNRRAWGQLALSVSALGIFGFAAIELAMLNTRSPAVYAELLRWLQVPATAVLVGLVGFVHFHLRVGRPWLGLAVGVSRVLLLIPNFLLRGSLVFTDVHSLFFTRSGNSVLAAAGEVTVSPFLVLTEVVHVGWFLYVADAAITLWRRAGSGERRRAVVLGVMMPVVVFVSAVLPTLLFWAGVRWPLVVTLNFAYLAIALSYELSVELARAAETARQLKTSEAALRESEQRLALAVEAAALAPWMWDAVRDEVWVDGKGRAFLGVGPEERIDRRRFLETVHAEERATILEIFDRAVSEGGSFEREYRHVRADGSVRWIFGRAMAERDAAGRVVRLRGVSVDVTERVEAQEALAAQRRELAQIVRVTMLGELTGALAHELNQPFASILSNGQTAQRLLAREPLDRGELREIVDDIVLANDQAAGVLQRVRTMLESNAEQRAPVDLNQVVNETLHLMRIELRAQGVEVETQLEESLPAVKGDRLGLQQVVLNLAVNACDAMNANDGAPRRLVICTRSLPGPALDLSVADTSPGILPEAIGRVFEPFYSTKSQGLGLGLSVCRTIVAAHGGRLSAANNPDRGATFRFTLPLAEAWT